MFQYGVGLVDNCCRDALAKLAPRIFESSKKAFFQHLFGGTVNELGWLLQYSANVLSSEF